MVILYNKIYYISNNIKRLLKMAKEKFIKSKVDKGKHDGRYSNVKREQAAQHQLKEVRAELPKRRGS
jgi:hypothetical protein